MMCFHTGHTASTSISLISEIREDKPFLAHLCFLARPYGEALARGELALRIEKGFRASRIMRKAGRWRPHHGGNCYPWPQCAAHASFDELTRLMRLAEQSAAEPRGV